MLTQSLVRTMAEGALAPPITRYDAAERRPITADVQRKLNADMPVIVLYQRTFSLHTTRV